MERFETGTGFIEWVKLLYLSPKAAVITRACERSGAGASDELEQKILGGAVSRFFNSLERNWSSTAQLCSSAAYIMSRPARVCVACLHQCASRTNYD